jgi:hypothetical protein
MQLFVAHATRMFSQLSFSIYVTVIVNFESLSSEHVSKVIRGYFSKPEGIRKQNRQGKPDMGGICTQFRVRV